MSRRESNRWSIDDAPDLIGKHALITGANSGIGLQSSLALARRGAHVVLACRDEERGRDALERVREETGSDRVELRLLDLGNLESVRAFAAANDDAIDILIANAGVMATPFGRTADGFERQLGVNYLGHFALAGLLLPALRRAPAARVVMLSSIAHRRGNIDFDDLQGLRRYARWKAYGQSKLAMLLFMREFDRRVRASGDSIVVTAAHPGGSATNLTQNLTKSPLVERIVSTAAKRVFQTDEDGALPVLYAASMPDVLGGEYFGPDGIGEVGGGPARVGRSRTAYDDDVAARLWSIAEELTGVVFPDLPPASEYAMPQRGAAA